nr:putative ribonuclease H-like domain-containing protein [Tanacetum cinerariifolium]
MDLFGPTFVKSLSNKSYCLVITDDYSRFSWVFFLDSKDETSPVLKIFIIGQENLLSLKAMNYHLVIAENQTNSNASFPDIEKAGEEGTQTYVLFLVLSDGSKNSQTTTKMLFDAQTRKQGDKTKNKDKGKSPVVTITGFRDLNAEFKECNNNSSNGVNAASSSVSTAGQNSINSTNDFSAVGPSNAAMPNLEDLSYYNDAGDVGAEADINNMESIISVCPIPTTRIYKDHPTSQIIGDLSSTTQTRSMARAVRNQGGISQMFNEDFHTCMFACFLLQEESK